MTALVLLQSFVRSAQLSACHLLRFVSEISAQFYHNFTTILSLNHFVHHEISQLFVTMLVQNTVLSRLNHGKYSAGYHDIFTIQYPVPLFSLCTKSLIAVLKDAKQLSEENAGGPFC